MMTPMSAGIGLIERGDAVGAFAHPLRVRILEALRQPESAAGLARTLGAPRQKVNYHLRELERAGLVRAAGERRKGNFVEQLYEPVADGFVISPRVTWGEQRQSVLRDQVALARLIDLGERLQRDGAELLARAAFEGVEVTSASVEAEVRFATPEERSTFMTEFLEVIGPLLRKHGARKGEPFRVALGVYPDPTKEE
jgi:DNA-binding transcriptional ArsR family regulator